MDEKAYSDTDLKLVEIDAQLKRILAHHVDFKTMFDVIKTNMEEIKNSNHALEIKMINGDNAVREECKELHSNMYRNIIWGAFVVVTGMIATFVGWVEKRL